MIPLTYAVMWIGNLALAGVPPFAGYFSKDAILEATYASGTAIGMYAFVLGTIVAFLTAFYSWRLLIMTFHGKPRADHHVMSHVHESPGVMTAPLVLLAIGAVCVGYLFYPLFLGEGRLEFWKGAIVNGANNHVLEAMEHIPPVIGLLPTVTGAAGILLAFVFYGLAPGIPVMLARIFRPIYLFVLNKWYFDELYDAIFVQPVRRLGALLWQVGDATLIDGVPNGVASLAQGGSGQAVRLQTGSIAFYAFTMLIGLVVLVGFLLLVR